MGTKSIKARALACRAVTPVRGRTEALPDASHRRFDASRHLGQRVTDNPLAEEGEADLEPREVIPTMYGRRVQNALDVYCVLFVAGYIK